MATSDEARQALYRMTRAAWHGIRMAGQNRPKLSIPPQPGDDDVLLEAVIAERDALATALADAETRAARLFSAAQRVAQLVTRLRRNDCDAAWAALDAALTDSTATPRPDAGQGVG